MFNAQSRVQATHTWSCKAVLVHRWHRQCAQIGHANHAHAITGFVRVKKVGAVEYGCACNRLLLFWIQKLGDARKSSGNFDSLLKSKRSLTFWVFAISSIRCHVHLVVCSPGDFCLQNLTANKFCKKSWITLKTWHHFHEC